MLNATEKKLLETISKLTDEEAELIMQVMDIVGGDPQKEQTVMELLKEHEVKTAAGRAAFLAALKVA